LDSPVGDQADHFPLRGQLAALATARPVPAPVGTGRLMWAALMLVSDQFLWYVLGA